MAKALKEKWETAKKVAENYPLEVQMHVLQDQKKFNELKDYNDLKIQQIKNKIDARAAQGVDISNEPTAEELMKKADYMKRLMEYRQLRIFLDGLLGRLAKARTRQSYHPDSSKVLQDWLMCHKDNPYPTMQQKKDLASRSGLSKKQVSNWFQNARSRDRTRTLNVRRRIRKVRQQGAMLQAMLQSAY